MIVVEVVARLRAVVVSLAGEGVMLWDTSIMHGFEASAKYSLQVGVIAEPPADSEFLSLLRISEFFGL